MDKTKKSISDKDIYSSYSEEVLRRDYPWRFFGAQPTKDSTTFRIYLPEATEVRLIREGNDWGAQPENLERAEDGVWSITVEGNITGEKYKYVILNDHEYLPEPYEMTRLDPYSFQIDTVVNPDGSRVYNSVVTDHDGFDWTSKPAPRNTSPMSIYELHLGTFCGGDYRDKALKLADHISYLGFTHVQIMPPFHTPIYESWGYLVGIPYAIYDGFGTLDDFKWLVNHLHEKGIGVILDVPMGFGIQDWDCGLANIDGTDLYHHAGAKGWNDQWRTRIYNHENPYVKNYLTGICSYLYHEMGIQGARIDAVAAQIFKEYDRGTSQWFKNDTGAFTMDDWNLINGLGGDRFFPDRGYSLAEVVDLPVLYFFREFHERLNRVSPGFITIAEESRRVFPRLATPVREGGLGFTYAQNMGEMHRVRKYLQKRTEERRIEEIEAIMLNHLPERFVNAMNTHDECANGRERLISEIKNHVQLIGLSAFCWFRPGCPMIFMGDEFCEEGWFDPHHMLDWGKTGDYAPLHCTQMTNCFHDLNRLLLSEPALRRQETWTLDRNGSNNEHRWFSFIRWGNDARWESSDPNDHKDDIIFVRNESHLTVPGDANIYLPAPGEYKVVFNSIDERYIGQVDYNRHEPYWRALSDGHNLRITLHPFQNIALKLNL